ncbi:MAG: helix-turn-helix transcriptional regulator [Thaumarchaeota archaeon]|nr:helix-turn-helix transcriptional regulator [Nitrososphaerota archaeon]
MEELKANLEHFGIKNCPINTTFEIIGKKFTLNILRNMIYMNHSRFNQFLGNVEGISPKTLSRRLDEMEKDKLIKRSVFNETPVRIEYTLTEKGKFVQSILEQMAVFSMKYEAKTIFRDCKPHTFKQVFGKNPSYNK